MMFLTRISCRAAPLTERVSHDGSLLTIDDWNRSRDQDLHDMMGGKGTANFSKIDVPTSLPRGSGVKVAIMCVARGDQWLLEKRLPDHRVCPPGGKLEVSQVPDGDGGSMAIYTETAQEAVERESREELRFADSQGQPFEPSYEWMMSFDDGGFISAPRCASGSPSTRRQHETRRGR